MEQSSNSVEKNLPCRHCNRHFRRLEHVQRHERTHTKETPFKCPCGRSFARQDLLRRHEKTAHGGQHCGRYERPETTSTSVDASNPAYIFDATTGLTVNTGTNFGNSSINSDRSLKGSRLAAPGTNGQQVDGTVDAAVEFLSNASDIDTRPTTTGHESQLGAAGVTGIVEPNQKDHVNDIQPVLRTAGLEFTDFHETFDGFNTFLDMPDFSTFLPDQVALDLLTYDVPALYQDTPNAAHQQQNHANKNSGGTWGHEQDATFSRFGSPLPALHFEAKDPPFGSSTGQIAPYRPCWKISAAEYSLIITKMKGFSQVLPEGFCLPSRHTMSRYIEGCIKGLYEHLPYLHIATFSVADAALELILSMCAVGAQFRFERNWGPALFYAAKVVIMEQTRRREKDKVDELLSHGQPPMTSSVSEVPTVDTENRARLLADANGVKIHDRGKGDRFKALDPHLQTLQAILGLLVMGAWGPQQLIREALSLQSLAASLARDDGFFGLKDSHVAEGRTTDWSSWILKESHKRTKLMTYCLLQLISTAYHIPPLILTSEVHYCLPTSAREWSANNRREWEEAHRSGTVNEISFQDGFESLFHDTAFQISTVSLPSLANYILMFAILQHIFMRRQMPTSSKARGLSSQDINDIGHALISWQTRWEKSPESSIDPTSGAGPIAFNSTALLRLGWIRLHADLGPCRNLASRDPHLIASAFNNGPALKRGPELIHPVLQAAHSLSVPVRMGINFVAKTQAVSWSVQHSLSNLECAIFLSKWLELLAITSTTTPLEKEELVLVQMIHGLLRETGLFEEDAIGDIYDMQDQKQRIRRLATAVARMWADIFKGIHVFEVVEIIGTSLTIYAESMESAYSPV